MFQLPAPIDYKALQKAIIYKHMVRAAQHFLETYQSSSKSADACVLEPKAL
jgi:hypothetical protein